MITKMMALTGLQSATNPENAAFVSENQLFHTCIGKALEPCVASAIHLKIS